MADGQARGVSWKSTLTFTRARVASVGSLSLTSFSTPAFVTSASTSTLARIPRSAPPASLTEIVAFPAVPSAAEPNVLVLVSAARARREAAPAALRQPSVPSAMSASVRWRPSRRSRPARAAGFSARAVSSPSATRPSCCVVVRPGAAGRERVFVVRQRRRPRPSRRGLSRLAPLTSAG